MKIPIAHIGLHFGEEPPISGTNGSGTTFFAGCNLACVFCQNYQISQIPKKEKITFYSPKELAQKWLELQQKGAHNINLISPTHLVNRIIPVIHIAKQKGLTIPIVYNSNGYDSVDILKKLDGLIDIYLPDIKYSDSTLAQKYSKAKDYVAINRAAIQMMYKQVGNLTCDPSGIAIKGLLVRHLILPNHLAGSLDSLNFLASISKEIHISLMSQYSPQFKAKNDQKLNRPITQKEYDEVIDHALSLGLENCFIQELESADIFIPNFNKNIPFK